MVERSRTDDELPVIRATYEFIAWAVPKVGKFPRDLRFTLGERIERQLLLLLELLIRARYSRAKRDLLDSANVELEILRFLIRLSHDLKALSNKDFGQTAQRVADIGQQIGGWRKQASA